MIKRCLHGDILLCHWERCQQGHGIIMLQGHGINVSDLVKQCYLPLLLQLHSATATYSYSYSHSHSTRLQLLLQLLLQPQLQLCSLFAQAIVCHILILSAIVCHCLFFQSAWTSAHSSIVLLSALLPSNLRVPCAVALWWHGKVAGGFLMVIVASN